jgi:hypothetical protein
MVWFVICSEIAFLAITVVFGFGKQERWKKVAKINLEIYAYLGLIIFVMHLAWTRMNWSTKKHVSFNLLFLDMIWTYSRILIEGFPEGKLEDVLLPLALSIVKHSILFMLVCFVVYETVQKLKKWDEEQLSDVHPTPMLELF